MSRPQAPRRIGLLGGSFDPPHQAHLALGRVALQTLALDELRWIPAGSPWQKAGQTITPGPHRAAMLRLLLGAEPRCVVDERELHRDGPTYTIDTVTALQAEWAAAGQAPAQWFLVLGQDQFGRLATWHRWRDLLPKVTWAVAGRAGQPPLAPAALQGLACQVVPLDLPPMAVSASDVRQLAGQGAQVSALVGEPVARYIDQHQLYAPGPGPVFS